MDGNSEGLLRSENVYDVMGAFHLYALYCARDAGAFAVFLSPDAIFSDGSLATMERCASEGYDCLFIAPLCTTQEEIMPWLDSVVSAEGPVAFPSRNLAGAAIRCLHPIARSMFWGSERFNARWASQFFWLAGENQMLAHFWHLHPLMVRPPSENHIFAQSIDGDFVDMATSDARNLIIQDSDDLCVVEVSPRHHRDDGLQDLRPFDRAAFLGWAASWLKAAHVRLARTPVFFHAGPIDRDALAPVQRQAMAVVESLAQDVEAGMSRLPMAYRLERLRQARRLFVYGCGEAGRAVRERLNQAGLTVAGFLDSRRGGVAHGLPVMTAGEYAETARDGDIVLVASEYLADIEAHILSLGIKNAMNGYWLYSSINQKPPLSFPIRRLGPGEARSLITGDI